MGMRHAWLTWLLLAGLVVVFTGARVLEGIEWLHLPLIILGSGAVLTAAAWRVAVWRGAQGAARSVEAVFALGYAGCALALAGYVPGTEGGLELLGVEFEGIREEIRFRRFFLVASPIVLGASLFPVLGAQWALAKGGTRGALLVDAMRVRETVANTLSVALAGAALMLVGYIASALNQTADFSFFKTATPGESVREIVRNMDGTLDAALFFPEVNAVKDEVRDYLDELSRATGKVAIAEYDRYANPEAAADYNARSDDGALFLRFHGRTEQIGFLLDLDDARGRLRILDSYVQQALLQLNRSRRFAYLTKGHGEFNDPISADEPEPDEPPSLREPWRPGMENEFDQGTAPPRAARDARVPQLRGARHRDRRRTGRADPRRRGDGHDPGAAACVSRRRDEFHSELPGPGRFAAGRHGARLRVPAGRAPRPPGRRIQSRHDDRRPALHSRQSADHRRPALHHHEPFLDPSVGDHRGPQRERNRHDRSRQLHGRRQRAGPPHQSDHQLHAVELRRPERRLPLRRGDRGAGQVRSGGRDRTGRDRRGGGLGKPRHAGGHPATGHARAPVRRRRDVRGPGPGLSAQWAPW